MPATHSPTPARSWIVRLARVCWERKKLSIIVVVASVSTILLAALTPLLTRQAVNDALAGNPTRLPWLACGLLLIAFFDFIGNYAAVMPGSSRCGCSTPCEDGHSTVFKNLTAQARTHCAPGR